MTETGDLLLVNRAQQHGARAERGEIPRGKRRFALGVLPGEGVGPEVIGAALEVIATLGQATGCTFEVTTGGEVGLAAERTSGTSLPGQVTEFCAGIFEADGAILSGPGGGRYVYALRAEFDLFCKLTPIRPIPALYDVGSVRAGARRNVDMLLVRENTGGLYFGSGGRRTNAEGVAEAFHQFSYNAAEISRIVAVAANAAKKRRGRAALAVKRGGIPAVSALWQEIFEAAAAEAGLAAEVLEVDNMAFQLVNDPHRFDVVVAPNMFGDLLGDCAGLLLGARGLGYSANLGDDGRAVFQTGHGAAQDLAGTDRANPVGQILSLAMLLRDTFHLPREAAQVESAVQDTLAAGWRTPDVAGPGSRVIGTRELGLRVAETLDRMLGSVRVP